MKTTIRQLGCALLILASGAALAAEPEQCRTVRLGTVNWTDVVASSAVAEALLDGLGYQVKQTSASQQIVLAGLADKQLDLFLGYWQPTMQPVARPYLDKGRIEVIEPPTLADAQSTYAVPSYVAEGGLKTFADIAPMNLQIDMTYLTGSEDVFGPDEGAATVSTMTAAGYQAQCGNVARLLHNLRFSSAQVSQVMAPILDRTQPLDAARQWLKANPEPLKAWLDGVSTFDGKDGLASLQASLK